MHTDIHGLDMGFGGPNTQKKPIMTLQLSLGGEHRSNPHCQELGHAWECPEKKGNDGDGEEKALFVDDEPALL
jgi:hypothetical protein